MGNCLNRIEQINDDVDQSIKKIKQVIHQNDINQDDEDDANIPTWNDTIPFVPPITEGYVIKVYDGDTITIASKLPGMNDSPTYRFSVRLNGIDTPEIKGKTNEEKQMAELARNKLENLILHQKVILRDVQTEKYGRVLAQVYLGNTCLNEWMINKRFAVRYDGGKKQSPKSWKRYYRSGVRK